MFISLNGVNIEIENFSDDNYAEVKAHLKSDLSIPRFKNRDAIQKAFSLAVSLAPTANASDLWHHVVYRMYTEALATIKPQKDAGQSWKRASGDAFEAFLADYYNNLFKDTSLRLIPLIKDEEAKQALKNMDIYGKVGDSKLDIAIIKNYNGHTLSLENGELIGGIHAKVSLAERVSDDVPTSKLMMEMGYLSYLFTLDVKSFPLSDTVDVSRAYVNKGELGSPKIPTDKQKYIEEHGSFDACFSLNARTVPSLPQTNSGKKIYTLQLNGCPDEFYNMLLNNFA